MQLNELISIIPSKSRKKLSFEKKSKFIFLSFFEVKQCGGNIVRLAQQLAFLVSFKTTGPKRLKANATLGVID